MTSEARDLLIALFAVRGGGIEVADRIIDAYQKEWVGLDKSRQPPLITKEEAVEIRKRIEEVGVPPPFGVLDWPGSDPEKRRKARELEAYIKRVCSRYR
ncbi:MAG: hypothetical protein IT284_00175 [Bacteroidetes bacterium]|nr:hypothetical protein [Bacteroidota bacterium]